MAATREAILLLWDDKRRKDKSISHLPGRSFPAQLPRYDLGGDQSRTIVESLRHLDYVLSPRLLVRLHPRLPQELPAKETNCIRLPLLRRGQIPSSTHSLRMAKKIWWSRYVICSAISNADSVSMLSLLDVAGGLRMNSKWRRPDSRSSRHNNRKSCDAARCSDGSKLGLHVMSSRKAMVCERKVASCSKSWKCFETQCRSTFKTRIVAGELTIDSLRFWATTSGGSSRGLLDPEIAMANAAAAVDVLLLWKWNSCENGNGVNIDGEYCRLHYFISRSIGDGSCGWVYFGYRELYAVAVYLSIVFTRPTDEVEDCFGGGRIYGLDVQKGVDTLGKVNINIIEGFCSSRRCLLASCD